MENGIIKVWAHRGASACAPENTLPAFAMAARMQADGVELDIQLTKDGEIDPFVCTGMLYSDVIIDAADYAAEKVGVQALHPALYHLRQDPEYVKKARAHGLETHVWTVNEPEDIRFCLDPGTEAVITNSPDLVRKIMVQRTGNHRFTEQKQMPAGMN